MASRHLSRSVAMQSLYEWDFKGQKEDNLLEVTDRNVKEFASGLEDPAFIYQLVNGVVEHMAEIDKIIEKAAPQWPLAQIAAIDRNVLRLGLFELLFGNRDEVPPKVAINESIELAKSFGGDSSSKFVNGVLGTIYREIGEPGKDDAPKTKDKKEDEVIGDSVEVEPATSAGEASEVELEQ